MVFYLNLRHIKILLSFTLTNIYKNTILDTKENILILAKKTILSESESIAKLIDYIDINFAQAAEVIFNSTGRIIVTGIGKSAIIAQKMVATFNSTGTPSLFLHASEAIHRSYSW
jgi:arabinose-5-phosphate isomerase